MKQKHEHFDEERNLSMRLELAQMSTPRTVEKPTFTDLELAMTSSAIGFEYAAEALEVEGELGPQAERLKAEIEQFKTAYFEARLQFKILDADRLGRFERDLTAQKAMIFGQTEQVYLH